MNQAVSSQVGTWKTIRNALTLNSQFYQAVQSSRKNRRAALTIVIFAAFSRALGNAIISLLNRVTPTAFLITLFVGIFAVIVGYYFWTFTIWIIGKWFKLNPPTYRNLLYPIGFAYSPQLFDVATIIPLLGTAIDLLLALWTLLAVAVVVHKAMRITMVQAVLISFVSFPVIQIVSTVIQVVAQQFTELAN